MTTWIEQGQHNPLPGDTLTAIEQEGFGTVCAVLDYEGESVYRILRAVNAHDDLLEALRTAAIIMVNTKEKAHKSARLCAIDAAERAIAKGEGRD